ncbi:MAG: hypothetical protein PVI57_21365 [Gemmatimonadota bacterium]|jgi:hypothetical protein
MLEIIAAGALGAAGYVKSKSFVRKRLRFTNWVEKPGLGLAAGVGTTILAAPLVALLPIVGAGTAIAAGIGVGTGVALGARQAKEGYVEEDDF